MKRFPFSVSCLALVLIPNAVRAQDNFATSFEQLRVLVHVGDTLTVTDTSGRKETGRLSTLSSDTLKLGDRTFAESEVRVVNKHDHADIASGAKWGLGVGVGFAATVIAVGCSIDRCRNGAGTLALVTALYGAMGAGIGVGIAAVVPRQRLTYVQPRSSAKRLTISPSVAPDRRGVSVSLAF